MVDGNQVRFSDPFQNNMRAAMGGSIGLMAAARDPSQMMNVQIPVHDRIAELLALTARAMS